MAGECCLKSVFDVVGEWSQERGAPAWWQRCAWGKHAVPGRPTESGVLGVSIAMGGGLARTVDSGSRRTGGCGSNTRINAVAMPIPEKDAISVKVPGKHHFLRASRHSLANNLTVCPGKFCKSEHNCTV